MPIYFVHLYYSRYAKIKNMKIKRVFKWCVNLLRNFWPWYKKLYKGRAWYTKTMIGFVSCIVAFFIYLGMVDMNFLWLFGKSPGYFSGILDPQTSEASESIDRYGR